MNQPTMFSHISGLTYIPEYITSAQEIELIKIIDSQQWMLELKRRVQHYGYKYDYRNRMIGSSQYLGPLPKWLDGIDQKLYVENIFPKIPNQVIVNEYLPGEGISAHIDCIPSFGDTICSLSLFSACIMDFTKDSHKESLLLAPRSLLILQKDARYLWKHSIAARKQINITEQVLQGKGDYL